MAVCFQPFSVSVQNFIGAKQKPQVIKVYEFKKAQANIPDQSLCVGVIQKVFTSSGSITFCNIHPKGPIPSTTGY